VHRTDLRTYALPYPAVFDAAVAVLGGGGPVTVADRERGRVELHGRLRTVVAFVGAQATTRTAVVIDVTGPLATRRRAEAVQRALDDYLDYWFTPSA
jgi:hypothetical protein